MEFITHFKDPNVANYLSHHNYKYVVVPVDSAPNNVGFFLCKSHNTHCLIKELGIGNSPDNPTYTPTTLTKEEILDNHGFRLCSFGISTNYKELDLPYATRFLKYTSVLGYIAGSTDCFTKHPSKYEDPFYQLSQTGLRVIVQLATQVMM